MKRITLLALLSFVLSWAYADNDEFYGKITTLSTATSLSTGQWYALYNASSKVFLCDDGSGTLTTSVTPATSLSSDYVGCFVKLEDAGDGTYHLLTGRGNYIGALSSSAVTATTASAEAAFTIATADDGASTWTFGNSGLYLDGSLKGTTSDGDDASWTLYAVKLNNESELTASERMTFQEKMFASGKPYIVRLTSKRSQGKYLTSEQSGVACGASFKSDSDLSQIWVILSQSSSGYVIASAQTSEYLTEIYSETGTETTLYIQESPNNSSSEYYFNISSTYNFSGQTCLNLGTDGATLYEWSCGGGDTGSDWAVETVFEPTADEVLAHMLEVDKYATALKDGAYYRIENVSYGPCITEDSNELICTDTDDTKYSQCWQLIANAGAWQLKNVLTDNYVQQQSALFRQYVTSTDPDDFYITVATSMLGDKWFIHNSDNTARVMRCNSSYEIVTGDTTNATSYWRFIEVPLDTDDITGAKENLESYNDLIENLDAVQATLDKLFVDKACTTLKDGIATLSDDELEQNEDYASLPDEIKRMVTKVKNDTWDYQTDNSNVTDSYERFFRIAEYSPYSHYQKMASSDYAVMGHYFARLSGPTGLYSEAGDILYIYVDEDPNSVCTLQVEMVTNADAPGDHTTGVTTDLHAGLNAILTDDAQDQIYIFYQLDDPDKYIADYPAIKIHIEGGRVNGYWDATRDMTNQDWANMKEMGLLDKSETLNLKTEHFVLAMESNLILDGIAEGHRLEGDDMEDVEKLMRIWELTCVNEQAYMGLEDFDGRLRNVWNAFSSSTGWIYATTYGIYYVDYAVADVMDYNRHTHFEEGNNGSSLWGISHELGHQHQEAIKVAGSTESTNELFANINLFEQGVSTTRYYSPVRNFDMYLAEGLPWNSRPNDVSTRMFFQLYLYFHAMGHDPEFLPNLFRAMRKDPLTSGQYNYTTLVDTNGDGVADDIGAYIHYGRTDYLHLAKKVCDVAQADLSEFFEAWGMFVPVENYYFEDYGNRLITTTQADIDSAREYMRRYDKKLGNIMFIDDHIEMKLADPDNKFEAVPAADGYKVNCNTYDGSKIGTAGDYGDFEQYDGHTEYGVSGDYYTLSGSTIQFRGSGCMGHKVYDLDGNLVWATNMKTTTIPDAVKSLFPDEVVVVAAEENMSDVPCPYYRSGSVPVYRMQVSFPDGVNNEWYASGNIDGYLPANAIAVIGTSGAPEALTSSINVVNTDATAQSVVIDGDLECRIPQGISAQRLSFTKADGGFQALSLPFAMSNATTIMGTEYVRDADVEAGEPLVINGAADISLRGVALSAGDFTAADSGNILAEDGSAVVGREGISPFVYLFDTTFELGNLDGVNEILSSPNAEGNKVYDMSGRRLTKVTRPGVYIVNGVKTLVR